MEGSNLIALLLFLKNLALTPFKEPYFCLLGFSIPFLWCLWFWLWLVWFLDLDICSCFYIFNSNIYQNAKRSRFSLTPIHRFTNFFGLKHKQINFTGKNTFEPHKNTISFLPVPFIPLSFKIPSSFNHLFFIHFLPFNYLL